MKDEGAQRVAMVQAKECQKLGEDATIPEENQVVEHSLSCKIAEVVA